MAMLAMAFPIPAGKTEQWKKFISELTGARKAEFAASRRSLGVRERTFLQHTPQGDLVLVTLEGDHPETAFAEFAKCGASRPSTQPVSWATCSSVYWCVACGFPTSVWRTRLDGKHSSSKSLQSGIAQIGVDAQGLRRDGNDLARGRQAGFELPGVRVAALPRPRRLSTRCRPERARAVRTAALLVGARPALRRHRLRRPSSRLGRSRD